MRDLLSWHAAEELEHRTLPYDIYEHIGGGYLMRAIPAAIAIPGFIPAMMFTTSLSMWLDKDQRKIFSLRRYVQAVRARRVPNVFAMLRTLPSYLRPGHHPDHVARHDEVARAYLAQAVMM